MRGALCLGVVVVVALYGGLVEGQSNACFPGERVELLSPVFPSSVERFGIDLFRRISASLDKSVFISPYSIWSVLTLAYFGSGGETRRQMENAMFYTTKTATYSNWNALKLVLERSDAGTTLRTSNRAYFSDQLRLNRCLANTLFDLRLVDFTDTQRAIRAINQEVNATTEGRIPELIKFLPPTTRFALVNAVFFKGMWESEFDPEQTNPRHEFLGIPPSNPRKVHMMFQTGLFKQGFNEQLDATMLELPYINSTISMFIFLPRELSTASIMNNLTPETFRAAYNGMVPLNTRVGLPRFKMTTRLEDELKETLISLGIVDLFIPGQANLTDFTLSAPLNVDAAIHQATVEVNEEGTVAAAATSLLNTRFGAIPVNFICNRPFVFLITDKRSGITLFAGEVLSSDDLEDI